MSARKSWQTIHPFKIFEEFDALERTLTPPSKESRNSTQLPVVADHLAKLQEITRLAKRPGREIRRHEYLRPSSNQQLIKLMTGPSLSSSDIDTWLQVKVVSESIAVDAQEKLENALLGMISVASANSTRSLMQYLARYWHSGLFGFRPMVKSARKQALALLDRAIQVHKPTHYVTSSGRPVPQVTVPDLDKFERFVNSFFAYLEFTPEPEKLDPLEERLFRLTCKGSTIDRSRAQLQRYLDRGLVLTSEAVDEFVSALTRYIDVEKLSFEGGQKEFRLGVMKNLPGVSELLPTHDATIATICFMLVWSEGLDEFWSVISLAEQSVLRSQLFNKCQYDMLESLAFRALDDGISSSVLMSCMFGLLQRIEIYAPIHAETYDLCLTIAAKNGNYKGVQKLMMKRENVSVVLENLVSSDSDPSELIEHILAASRPEDTAKLVAMLQRLGSVSEVEDLWAQLESKQSAVDLEALLVFLAAVSIPKKRDVIDFAFLTPYRAEFCKQAITNQLCQPEDLYKRVIEQARSEPPSWSSEDLKEILADVDNWHELLDGTMSVKEKWP